MTAFARTNGHTGPLPVFSSAAEGAHRRGARLVIVNQGETPLDDPADVDLREPIGEVLPRIVAAT